MGKIVTKKKVPEEEAGTMTINLFGPGMTALHKVGLAGLWMTLKVFEDESRSKARLEKLGGSWECNDTSVTLRWDKQPEKFFQALFEESFKIDKNGLIWFPALGNPINYKEHSTVLQGAVLSSFLQHGRTRKADKSTEPQGNLKISIDETPLVLQYRKVYSYVHQDESFSSTKTNKLAGWSLPGGAVRHVGLGQGSALEESPGRTLALRFAPVGAIYFEVRQRGGGVKPRYSIVLPEIQSLETYADARRCFLQYGTQQLYVSGTADAGFRVLAELEAANLLRDVSASFCRVISFGTVPWSTQQKTRVNIIIVRAGSKNALKTFNRCHHLFKARLVKREGKESFWSIPQVPDLVARNLSEGRKWWEGFADFVADKDRREHVFNYEKGGLIKMVEDKNTFIERQERIFVEACHEAWKRRMGQIGEKAKRERSPFGDQVQREFKRLHALFSRCKNAASLREAVTDFWARGGGPLESLQEGWHEAISLLNEKNWRKAKDWTLLALASYKPASKEEAEALGSSETNTD